MATKPTDNPIPSESPKDLKFNAGNFDKVMNSDEEAYQDRFGKARLTMAGFEAEAQRAISSVGYSEIGDWEIGKVVTSRNQIVNYNGSWYRFGGDLPYTISTESPTSEWVNIGDASLRSSLAKVGSGFGSDMIATPMGGTVSDTIHYVSPEMFGAVGDGTTDDAGALQDAIDYVSNVGGGVKLKAKKYRINNKVTINSSNVVLAGVGEGASVIVSNVTDGDLITIGDGKTNPNNVIIKDLSILVNAKMTSGSVIKIVNGHACSVRNFRLDGEFYNGITLLAGGESANEQFIYRVENFEINGVYSDSNDGIVIGDGAGDPNLVQDVWISRGVIANCGGDGIKHVNASGIYADNVDVLGCKNGITFVPSENQKVKGSFYTACLSDTCSKHGWLFDTRGGVISDLIINGCWGSSCGTTSDDNGFMFTTASGGSSGYLSGIVMNGAHAVNNMGSGIRIAGGTGISLSNCECSSNGMSGPGKHGVEILDFVSGVIISGGRCSKSAAISLNNQDYGVFIGNGVNHLSISGVNCTENKVGGINNPSSGYGAEVNISSCPGYRTKKSGSMMIKSGETSASMASPVDAVMSAGVVQVTPTSDIGNIRYWVEISKQDFVVRTSNSVDRDIFFSWSVDASQLN